MNGQRIKACENAISIQRLTDFSEAKKVLASDVVEFE